MPTEADAIMNASGGSDIRVLSRAVFVPSGICEAANLLQAEGWSPATQLVEQLGIKRVHSCETETGSDLGLLAARAAIARAGIPPISIDVIVDYSVMPQDYLVPAWSMSNKLQHELGATKSFTIGFSGGLSSGMVTAMHFVWSLMRSDESIATALLVGADRAIKGNRVIGTVEPFTMLGDGASAMVLKRGAGALSVLGSELWTDGAMHDVLHIPGGAMAMPDRGDLYRLHLDVDRYDGRAALGRLRELARRLLDRHGLGLKDVTHYSYPNLSRHDRQEFARAFEIPRQQVDDTNLSNYGHLHGTDLVLNLSHSGDAQPLKPGDHVLVLSPGFGFTYGATLLRVDEGATP